MFMYALCLLTLGTHFAGQTIGLQPWSPLSCLSMFVDHVRQTFDSGIRLIVIDLRMP